MGGGDDAHIDGNGLIAAHALDDAFLENTQQQHLCGRRNLGDLIEKDGALLRHLEPTEPAFGRAREGAAFVAEKFTGQKLRIQGGAVYLDEQTVAAAAELMDGLGNQFLAGAGFAENQHGAVGLGHLLDRQSHCLHGRTGAGQRAQVALAFERLAQIRHFMFDARLQLRDRFAQPRILAQEPQKNGDVLPVGNGGPPLLGGECCPQSNLAATDVCEKTVRRLGPKRFIFPFQC